MKWERHLERDGNSGRLDGAGLVSAWIVLGSVDFGRHVSPTQSSGRDLRFIVPE